MLKLIKFASLSLLVSLFLIGCAGPKFPNCEKNEHCKTNLEGQAVDFVCYNKTCVECSNDEHCADRGPNMQCNMETMRCEEKPECMTNEDCASINPDYVCRAEKCVPECSEDSDCDEGQSCSDQRCVAYSSCTQDIDCGPGMKCVDGTCFEKEQDPWQNVSAQCQPFDKSAAVPGEVKTSVIRFDFNESNIRPDMRSIMDQNAQCLKQQGGTVELVIEGHCDERGTQEYNLALGERRAETVKDYLVRMGVDSSRIRIVSKGENEPMCRSNTESCWAKNRRAEFIQKQGY